MAEVDPRGISTACTRLRRPLTISQLCVEAPRGMEERSRIVSYLQPKQENCSLISRFVSIGISHDFVMHALLAWSANQMPQIKKHPRQMQEVYHHCEHALDGLQKAIASFSKENSDAVLCASIIMAWQASDS